MKIGFYCYLPADILTNVLQECSKRLNLIGCHGNKKRHFFAEANVMKILQSFGFILLIASEKMMFAYFFVNSAFSFSLLLCFLCYGNLKFPLTYNGKIENWPLLLHHWKKYL